MLGSIVGYVWHGNQAKGSAASLCRARRLLWLIIVLMIQIRIVLELCKSSLENMKNTAKRIQKGVLCALLKKKSPVGKRYAHDDSNPRYSPLIVTPPLI
jgi:hypothetical protein